MACSCGSPSPEECHAYFEAIQALNLFDPLIARWFAEEIGPPTDIQHVSLYRKP
jgi:hypothetical protein